MQKKYEIPEEDMKTWNIISKLRNIPGMANSYVIRGPEIENSLALIVVHAFIYDNVQFENSDELYKLGIDITNEQVEIIGKYWDKVRALLGELELSN